jgi:hypothetical protein
MLRGIQKAIAAFRWAIGKSPAHAPFAVFLSMILVSACTSDTTFSMRPSVDVGAETAAVPTPIADPQTLAAPDPLQPQTDVASQGVAPPPGEMPVQSPDAYPQPQMDPPQTVAAAQPFPGPQTVAAADPYPQPDTAEAEQEGGAVPPADAAILVQPEPLPQPEVQAEPEVRTAAVITPPSLHRPPQSDLHAVAYPRLDAPRISRPAVMPPDEAACRRELRRLGVIYRDLPPINDGGECHIDYPVKVSQLSGGIAMEPPATLDCEMAATFALWTKRELAPAARFRYFSGVRAIHQASSYSCRNIAGTHTSSEHARGNALDVSRIELKNGRDIDVRKPGWFAFRQRGFLNSVRADGCEYFTTVLGPGYNYDHRNHFHFDIKPRQYGRRACH